MSRKSSLGGLDREKESLLNQLEGKWVKVLDSDGVFLYHRRNGSRKQVEQLVISGNALMDGIYVLKRFDLDQVFDRRLGRPVIRIHVQNYDQKMSGSDDPDFSWDQFINQVSQRLEIPSEEIKLRLKTVNIGLWEDEVILDV